MATKNFRHIWCIVSLTRYIFCVLHLWCIVLVRCIYSASLVQYVFGGMHVWCYASLVRWFFGALHLWCVFSALYLWWDASLVWRIFGMLNLRYAASLVHFIFGELHLWWAAFLCTSSLVRCILGVIYIRVSPNTPFFELSLVLLTTHAIGLEETTCLKMTNFPQIGHFQAGSPRVAKGRQGFPRSKRDPRDGWDEL